MTSPVSPDPTTAPDPTENVLAVGLMFPEGPSIGPDGQLYVVDIA
jgi:sugar lactone lactonase YvrE